MTTKHPPICSSPHFQTIWHSIRTLQQFLRVPHHVLRLQRHVVVVTVIYDNEEVIWRLSKSNFDENIHPAAAACNTRGLVVTQGCVTYFQKSRDSAVTRSPLVINMQTNVNNMEPNVPWIFFCWDYASEKRWISFWERMQHATNAVHSRAAVNWRPLTSEECRWLGCAKISRC